MTGVQSGCEENPLSFHAEGEKIYYFDIVDDYPAIGGVVEFSRLLFRQLKRRYGSRLVPVRDVAATFGLADASMPYLHRERLVAERLAVIDPASTFFFPNFQSPVPGHARAGGPRVVNVLHDVQFAYLPELFAKDTFDALKATFAEARDNADEIIFISEAARDQFLATIGTPRRHRVIHNPIDAGEMEMRDAVERRPFLLASLHHHPHKNFPGLIAFFGQLAAKAPELELVITGHGGEKVARLIDDLPADVRGRVRHLGYVPRRRLNGLHRRARAFISLSRFEGFNMSAAEAACHGTPLLLSDLPVHRELFTGQACFLDASAPSVDAAEAFLAACDAASLPRWAKREACRPDVVGRAYATCIDALIDATSAKPAYPRATQPMRARRSLAMNAAPRRPSAKRRLLGHAVFAGATLALVQLAAAAPGIQIPTQGGAGGGHVSGGNYTPGGAGGEGYSGEQGANGGSVYYGAGGGAAGGGTGGTGGPSACNSSITCPGYVPAAGGAGGTLVNRNGSDGQGPDAIWSGGAGGGGGGEHGNDSGLVSGPLIGGNGGNGGSVLNSGHPGGGGGGGAGGYGALLGLMGPVSSDLNFTGGNGGDGGDSSFFSFRGGSGGQGGAGIGFISPGAILTNLGTVTGGNGGLGGAGGSTGGAGAVGAGGVGIAGSDLAIINGGTITGGLSGDGVTQASAVQFLGGINQLSFLNATSGLSGAIELDNAALTFEQATDVTVANAIIGTGTLTKTGAGMLNLTGDSSAFTGAMTIAAGRLAVNGALGSAIEVQSGGILSGNGTTGSLTIASGGKIEPGNSIGTLTVNGDVTFAPGSAYIAELAGSGASDLISASGQIFLNGASLLLLALDPQESYQNGQSFVILDAAGGVVGSFGSVATSSIFLTAMVNDFATGVNVVVTLPDSGGGGTPTPNVFPTVAVTPNQFATAAALDGLAQSGPSLALYNSLLFLSSASEARHAFDQLSGEVHASAQSVFMEQSSLIRGALNDRLRAAQSGVGASAGTVVNVVETSSGALAYAAPSKVQVAADMSLPVKTAPVLAPVERFALWTTGFGNWGSFDGTGNASGINDSTGGFLIGADTLIGSGWRVGVAGGYSYSDFSSAGRNASGSSDNWHAGVYAGNVWGQLALRTGLSYTWQDVSTSRNVAFTGFFDSLSADYDTGTFQAFGELGWRFETAFAAFEPFANLAYVSLDTSGYFEEGGAAALFSDGSDMDTTFTTLGLRTSKEIALGSYEATLRGLIGWRHAFGDITPSITQAFLTSDAFTVTGVPIAEDAAVIEAGLDLRVREATTLGIAYTGQFGGGVTQNGFNARLSVRF